MAPLKCCVLGCESTSNTHRLFCMPMNNNLRNLWMSFLVPVNPHLLGLTKEQLLTKRVCQKHFDETQFSQGSRIRYSYPCLFTEKDFLHGVPLSSEEYNVLNEHNYCSKEEPDEDTAVPEPVVLMGMSGDVHLQEHLYLLPSTSEITMTSKCNVEVDVSMQELQVKPVSGSTVLSETDASKNYIEGLSSTRKPLMDISHQYNVTVTSELCETLHPIPEEHNVAEASLADTDTSKKSSINNAQPIARNHPTSKDNKTIKYFSAKTRRLIKIAADSLGQTSTERLKNAHAFASLGTLENFEKLNKKAKSFLLMQLRLARKNKMARRFSLDDKLYALALMKQSPKCYKLLENMFALPTKRTLARLSQRIVFDCGINENTIDQIKNSTENWDTKKRLCSLVFDEVALTPHLIYNESKDIIHGFEDISGQRRQKFADHALVFMIRGICSSWRQSIAYYFCAGTVSAPELEKILKEIIPKLVEAGLTPLALVCDQGSTFRSCIKNLRAKTAEQTNDIVNVAGHDLFIFHDPPHLLKSIRNNFLSKDIVFEGKRASWEDIMYVYDVDMQAGHTRALPRLTADHVDPKRIKKMKVKMAAQVLSARTAAMLNFTDSVHRRVNRPMETMKTTAALVLFFDELFDSVNGSPGQAKGKLRCGVKENSVHIEFWRTAVQKLKNMSFIDKNSKVVRRTGQPRHVRVPCLEGWVTTLNSFLGLSKLLFSVYKVEFFYPRFINQDPLENFFGRIRAVNYRHVNPDANTFINSFKSLAISNILAPHSNAMNCEDDDGETLINLSYLFKSYTSQDDKENVPTTNANNAPSSSLTSFRQQHNVTTESATAERVRVQTSAYTAGYICRKITRKMSCKACSNTYTSKEHQGIHEYIQHREYKRLKNNNLKYPNARFVCVYRRSAQMIHDYLNVECHQNNIKKNLKIIIKKNCDLSWLGCKKHQQQVGEIYLSLIIRLQVHNWCNILNKILSGKIEEKYVLKMHTLHLAALKKCKSYRLRQKVTK